MANNEQFTQQAAGGPIKYPDGSVLLRPQSIRGPLLIVFVLLLAAGCVIGYFAINAFSANVLHAAENEKARVQELVAASPSLNVPVVANYLAFDDIPCITALEETGAVLTDLPRSGENTDTVDVAKVNEGVTPEQTLTVFQDADPTIGAFTAAQTLIGAWRFSVNRDDGTAMRLRYADFASGSPTAALQNALTLQGYTEDLVVDSGVDESGNTYSTGVVSTELGDSVWRVSVALLSDIYSIKNLPDTAYFVSVRVTA
ncbi:MAG: hypothetical protein Q4E12_04940 [Coriobacteriia bacterium]|nr:hypothetical protein [Coriobacteriia bacterium]